ncbi:hypothetical protein ACRALDRAFT_1063789 [Sodiomyces alcalophilus JCM 7366]|uniref:uncharacterized protein n=1 Tax=Sodiomyces alcalophilus JCM 7366 TaxID=591952 RepID=UPI0039B5F5AF
MVVVALERDHWTPMATAGRAAFANNRSMYHLIAWRYQIRETRAMTVCLEIRANN